MPKTAAPPKLIPFIRKGRAGPAIWTIVWRENGVTRRRETGIPVAGTDEHRQATKAFAAYLEGQKTVAPPPGQNHTAAAQVSVPAVLDAYVRTHEGTIVGERAAYAAQQLAFFFQRDTMASLTRPRVQEYIRWRRGHSVRIVDKATGRAEAVEAKISDGTIRRDIAGVLTPAINHAMDAGLLEHGYYRLPRPAQPKPRDYWITRSEAARLLWESRGHICNDDGKRDSRSRCHLPLFIRVALYTGQRKEAILDLTWDQINFVTGTIDFNPPGRGITKKGRAVQKMPRQLRLALFRAKTRYATSTKYVIAYDGEPVSDIKHGLRSAALRAGLPRLTAHTLRHTATSWLVQAGVDLMVAGGYIGHRDPATTKRYAHHAPNYQDKAVAALERRDRRQQHAQRRAG